ncbi:GntR family transcriptional regulator [Amorphus orientalis]|uniref:GntR family transcriptional regulator of vanillate catabolism n=1 Tax=Amorphus orientalis TaxID=649198 RepID=A0AAE4ARV1_9HYPH|nr:GntR family transcriptional regulator [Amorphus orientalis]MDQ0314577.1 GntR family transcriptional regulator of vanillate catabolism [Amorphus orientalis]
MGEKGGTAAESATAMLREMILAGELRPGARVHQDHLSEDLGLSRTPLRTAMATLARDGLLDYEANRGYRVKQFSVDSIRSVFEIRSVLESQACRAAARRGIGRGVLDTMDALVRRGDELLSVGRLDPDRLPPYRKMNVDFHNCILEAAQNPWLRDFVDRTHNVPMVSDRVILWDDYDVIYRSHDDHHRIARALRRGDGERAALVMYEHVAYAGELLVTRLEADPDAAFKLLSAGAEPPLAMSAD